MARAPWLALLNPDATPQPDWLEQLFAATHRHPDAVMFGSTQIDAADAQKLDGTGDHYLATGIPWRGGHAWPVSALPPEGEVFAPWPQHASSAPMLFARPAASMSGFSVTWKTWTWRSASVCWDTGAFRSRRRSYVMSEAVMRARNAGGSPISGARAI